MKNKLYLVIFLMTFLMLLTACDKKINYALEFKNEYESLNGVVNKNGKEHRTISISKENPYIKVTPNEIVEMISNKDTFYLYVGDALCPWCRSVLEKSIEVAKDYGINKIYYIDIWDDEGNEILRDKYEFQNENIVKVIDGTESYYKLLEYFDSVLSEYTLTNKNGDKVLVGEKRIYAPNFFYIKNGSVVKMIDGISEKQTDSREELTEEMLRDQEKEFKLLFELDNKCDLNGC